VLVIIKSQIYARVIPGDIDMLTKIMEGYEHLGIVSTIDSKKGVVLIRGTEDTCEEIIEILSTLPFPLEILQGPGLAEFR